MINELIIHLGDTKTGSTSIQAALLREVARCPGKTVLYPTNRNHIRLASTLTKKRLFNDRETYFAKLAKIFQNSKASYGIISAEHFETVDPLVLHNAIETHWSEFQDRLRLVAYVRPHGGKLLSNFSESVKLGAKLESLEDLFEKWSNSDKLDYTPRFRKWREVFGDRFELRPFVRDQMYKGDVVQDFFRYVFESEEFEVKGKITANTSLTISQLALFREVQKQLSAKAGPSSRRSFKEAQGALGRLISDHIQSEGLGGDGEKPRMPVALVDRFKKRFAADAEALDSAFFNGFPMSEALDGISRDATGEDQSLDIKDHFDAETVRSVRVFANVLADIAASDPDLVKLAVARVRTARVANA